MKVQEKITKGRSKVDHMFRTRISRRTFLKILGFGIVAGSLGVLNNTSIFLLNSIFMLVNRQFSSHIALAQRNSWSRGLDTTIVAAYAALLANNEIFYLSGSGSSFTSHRKGLFE